MRFSSGVSGAILILALALSGCGGDDSDDDQADSDDSNVSISEGDETSGEPGEAGESGESSSEESPGSGVPEGDQVDVCALVTPADLDAAFGSTFDKGEFVHQEQTGGDQCVWSNTDAPPARLFSVTVLRDEHLGGVFEDSGVTVQQLHADSRDLTPDAEDIDLGDDAYLWGGTLSVLDGDTSYTFTTTDIRRGIEGMLTLAEQVVG